MRFTPCSLCGGRAAKGHAQRFVSRFAGNKPFCNPCRVFARLIYRARNGHHREWFPVITFCLRCNDVIVDEFAVKVLYCPPCKRVQRREDGARFRATAQAVIYHSEWADRNPEKVKGYRQRSKAKQHVGVAPGKPVQRTCDTLLCGQTFIVSGPAKGARRYCKDCQAENLRYQNLARYNRRRSAA